MEQPTPEQRRASDYHTRMAAQYAADADRKAVADARVRRARPANAPGSKGK